MKRLTGQRQRGTRVCVVLACALALAVVAVAGAIATTSRHGLDRSYGKGGVVEVPSPFADGKDVYTSASGFGAEPDGSAYVIGSALPCEGAKCHWHIYLTRFRPDGARDSSFGERGAVFLRTKDEYPSVFADGAGRAIVVEKEKEGLVLRRFKQGGEVDGSYGKGGVVVLPCPCGEGDPELLGLPGGRLLIVESRGLSSKKVSYESRATKVRVLELRSDGAVDRSFGRSGTLAFKVPKPGPMEAITRTADGGFIAGGATWGSPPRTAWLWRVTATGKVDRGFNRNAADSLRRLGRLGEFPDLLSIVPRADGTIAAVGTIHEHLGFVLRLRRNGKLDTDFGDRGLTHLPANVEDAVGGTGGSVFIVGEGKRHYFYSAYRVLGDGRLDPAYRGVRGVRVPLPGEGVEVQSLGGGRALVAGYGSYECRENCPPEPGMARFLE